MRSALNLLTDADFDQLVLDFWPHVHGRFGRGMDKTERINLLFSLHVSDGDVERALRQCASTDDERARGGARSA